MGTPETATKKFGIWEKLELLKRGAELGERMEVEGFQEIMDLTREIVLPFVKQLDKPIFPKGYDLEYIPHKYWKKRGVLMFKSKIITIWLQRSGKWFIQFQKRATSNFIYLEPSSSEISEIILSESGKFFDDFVERAKNCLTMLPFLEQTYLYYILPLNFVTQSFETIKKAVEERRQQLLRMEETLGFLGEFTQSLDPLTCRRKKTSLTEYSIFRKTRGGECRDTSDYYTSGELVPFWGMVDKYYGSREEHRENITERKFDSLDDLIRHLMYICNEITNTPEENNSAEELFGRNSGRLPFSKGEIAVIKELIEFI